MDPTHSVFIEIGTLHAGRDVIFGDVHNYYASAERSGLHVGVPPRPTHFVGREALVADVARRLIGGSTLALSADGLPGVGKTTLAVALAYRREVLDHFTDGVLWGALGLQPNVMEVLASWAAALGEDVSKEGDAGKRAAAVRSAIGQRKLLLVIDDAWERENAMLLRCGGPNCAHFLTTRDDSIARDFAGVDCAVEIRELEPNDALHLLTALAPEACAADPEAAARLVEAVGYLPLAIELMGAYLSSAENRYFREQQEAALQQMVDPAERLRQACKRLGDTRDTKLSLREIIRLSLEGLPAEAVAAFHALGAFAPKPETFDPRAALAVTGASPATLSRLIERHILEKQGDALSLHQTIADVAREDSRNPHPAQSVAAGRRRTPTPAVRLLASLKRRLSRKRRYGDPVQAHADHYLERVKEAGEDWQSIEAIYGQTKWSFSQIHDDAVRVLDFTAVLRRYQTIRGLRADGLRWNELEIQAARIVGDLKREAVALNNRGWLYDSLGERDRALRFLQQALPLRRAIGDRQGEAVALNNIGSIYNSLGERDRALEYFQQALPILRTFGDREGEAVTLNNIGRVHDGLGERDRALQFLQQALPIQRAVGDRQGEARTLNKIGGVHIQRGEHVRAREFFEQALPLLRAVGDQQGEAETLGLIGNVHYGLGERDRALEYFQQALSISRAVGDRRNEAVTLNNIGGVYYSLGDHHRALELYLQALPILHAIGERADEARALSNIGGLYHALNDCSRALECLDQALPISRAVGDCQGEARTLNRIGLVHNSLGEHDRALEFFQQALPIVRAVGDRQGEAEILNNIGLVHHRRGEIDRALEIFQQALPIMHAVGDRQGEATTLNNVGLAYGSVGERDRALEFFQQALPIQRAVGDRAGEAVTRFNIAMIHRAEGRLEEAAAELRQVVELDIAVQHPDLESDRRFLAQVEAELAERDRQ